MVQFVLQQSDGVWIDRTIGDNNSVIAFKFKPYSKKEQKKTQRDAIDANNASNKIEFARKRCSLAETIEELNEAEAQYDKTYARFSKVADDFNDEPTNRLLDWRGVNEPDPDNPENKNGVPVPFTLEAFDLAWKDVRLRMAFEDAFEYLLNGSKGRTASEGNSSKSRKRGRARN